MKRQKVTSIILFVSVGVLFGSLGYSVERWNSQRANSVEIDFSSKNPVFPELVVVETDGDFNGN